MDFVGGATGDGGVAGPFRRGGDGLLRAAGPRPYGQAHRRLPSVEVAEQAEEPQGGLREHSGGGPAHMQALAVCLE